MEKRSAGVAPWCTLCTLNSSQNRTKAIHSSLTYSQHCCLMNIGITSFNSVEMVELYFIQGLVNCHAIYKEAKYFSANS